MERGGELLVRSLADPHPRTRALWVAWLAIASSSQSTNVQRPRSAHCSRQLQDFSFSSKGMEIGDGWVAARAAVPVRRTMPIHEIRRDCAHALSTDRPLVAGNCIVHPSPARSPPRRKVRLSSQAKGHAVRCGVA